MSGLSSTWTTHGFRHRSNFQLHAAILALTQSKPEGKEIQRENFSIGKKKRKKLFALIFFKSISFFCKLHFVMVCGNNHIVQIKVLSLCTGTECTDWAGSFTSLSFEGVVAAACLWGIFFCGIAFFIFLGVCIRITSHCQFKLWDIVTPEQGCRSPEPAVSGREASVASRPSAFSPHLAWQLPSSFFIYCEKGQRCFISAWKQEDLNMFFHTCVATSSRWDSCQICPVLLPLRVYENIPQPHEPPPNPFVALNFH